MLIYIHSKLHDKFCIIILICILAENLIMKIEKNIPLPEGYGAGRPLKYPWDKMKEGDSFFIKDCDSSSRISIRNTGASYYKHRGIKLTVSSRKEGKGVRFWVIKKI